MQEMEIVNLYIKTVHLKKFQWRDTTLKVILYFNLQFWYNIGHK